MVAQLRAFRIARSNWFDPSTSWSRGADASTALDNAESSAATLWEQPQSAVDNPVPTITPVQSPRSPSRRKAVDFNMFRPADTRTPITRNSSGASRTTSSPYGNKHQEKRRIGRKNERLSCILERIQHYSNRENRRRAMPSVWTLWASAPQLSISPLAQRLCAFHVTSNGCTNSWRLRCLESSATLLLSLTVSADPRDHELSRTDASLAARYDRPRAWLG
jgi:hypothetical protein